MALKLNSGEKNDSPPSSTKSKAQCAKILLEALTLWDGVFPGQDRRDMELIARTYLKGLEQLSPHQLATACAKVLERTRYFPTIAQILELAGEPGAQSVDLDAEREWQSLLRDFDEWGSHRTSSGSPLKATKISWGKRADQNCAECTGLGWCPMTDSVGVHRWMPCLCTNPRRERVPELPPATIFTLSRLGGYYVVRDQVSREHGSFLRKDFLDAFVYYRRTGALAHQPVGKTDAVLLDEIQKQTGVRVLRP
jgi:hypothetical protein